MTETTKTKTPERVPEPKASPSDDKPATTRRDALMEALEANPRFVVIKPSGKGFILPTKG